MQGKEGKNAYFPIFEMNFFLRAEPSQAELKIVQLKLWLEPAWLGLITTAFTKIKEQVRAQCSNIYTVPRKGVLSSKTSPDSMVFWTCINNVDGTMTRCYFQMLIR